jgi:hypothetical protein
LADTLPLPLAQLRAQGTAAAEHDVFPKMFTFTRDLARRYPAVHLGEALRTPILFDLAAEPQGPEWDCIAADEVQLAITIAQDGSRCRWQFPEQLTGTMRMLLQRLLAYLDRVSPS